MTLQFSNSEIQTFKRCKRKWWLAWYRELELAQKAVTGPRAIGTRVHRALAMYYVPDGETPVDPRLALETCIAEDQEQINPEDEISSNEFEKNAALERAMIEGYVQWLEESGEDQGLKVIGSEQPMSAEFSIPDHDVEITLIGLLDVRVVRESDNARMFLDHKTVPNFTEPTKTLHMNEQMLHYHLLEWLNTPENEQRCVGALYNMLRKVKRTARAQPPFYQRTEVRHTAQEIGTFATRLQGIIGSLLDLRNALDNGKLPLQHAYPTPTSTCAWDCDFFPVCPMFDDGSAAESMLESFYAHGDPRARYTQE